MTMIDGNGRAAGWVPQLGIVIFFSLCASACPDAEPDVSGGPDSGRIDGGADGGTSDVADTDAIAPTGSEVHRSGERLIARTLGGLPTTFRDTELEIACAFSETLEGAIVCMPEARSDPVFADPECRVPLVVGASADGALVRVSTRLSPCANPTFAPLSAGPSVVPSDVYTLTGTECTRGEPEADVVYRSATQLPTEMFVSAERSSRSVGDSLSFVQFVGEDGSLMPETFFDERTDSSCGATTFTTTDVTPCFVPTTHNSYEGHAYIRDYRNSECTDPLITGPICPGEDRPEIATRRTWSSACGVPSVEYVRFGAETPVSSVRYRSDGMCTSEGTIPDSFSYHEVGEALSSQPPEIVSSLSAGEGIEALWWGPDSNTPLVSGFVYVVPEYGYRCRAPFGNEATDRCVPIHAADFSTFFADAECMEPVGFFGGDDCVEPEVVRDRQIDDSGVVSHRVFSIGDSVSGPIYQGVPGDCSVQAGTGRYYRVGDELPEDGTPALRLEEI